MRPDTLGRIYPDTLRTKVFGVGNKFFRENAVLDDFLLVIDIIDEKIQCINPLLETFLDQLPFISGNNARDNIEGPGPVDGALFLRIHGKGNTHDTDSRFGRGLVLFDILVAQ